MIMVENFYIHFPDQMQPVFYTGSSVVGEVIVELREILPVTGIKLCITGDAKVKWSVNENETIRKIVGAESYFKKTIPLFGLPGDLHEYTLPEGKNTFQFSVFLPPDLPSSVESSKGGVTYSCKAVIERLWRSDLEVDLKLLVLKPKDLNFEPLGDLLEPFFLEGSKNADCCCCSSGTVNVRFSMNKSAIAVGEHIPCFMEVVNRSDRAVSCISVQLEQIIAYTVHDKLNPSVGPYTITATNYVPVLTLSSDLCAYEKYSTSNNLEIPAVAPSGSNGSVVSIAYNIQFSVTPSCTLPYAVKHPVQIGTVPYTGDASQSAAAVTSQPVNQSLISSGKRCKEDEMSTAATLELPSGPPLPPPPSYDECIRGEDDDDAVKLNMVH